MAKHRNKKGYVSKLKLIFQFERLTLLHTKQRKILDLKRYGQLFDKICDLDNLYLAYQNAKRGKGWYEEVQIIDQRPFYYLAALRDKLKNHLYKTSDYEIFIKQEHDKARKIYKLPFYPDRIAQWAIIQVIEPYLLKHFITDTYSAIPNKGIHFGLNRLTEAMWNDVPGCQYCLKLDIRHYYQSIDHGILKQKYRRLFKDPELLWILDEIIDSVHTADIEDETNVRKILHLAPEQPLPCDMGVPIGNYLSQYSGNFYLSDFDHWIKEEKHVKHYFRYMDDICIFANTKEELHQLFKEIKVYLNNELHLTIKGNYQVFPSYVRGVDFLGYRVFLNYILLRKSTCKQMKKKLNRINEKVSNRNMMNYSEWCSIHSYNGWLCHCDSYRLHAKYVKPLLPYADEYYYVNIKRKAA